MAPSTNPQEAHHNCNPRNDKPRQSAHIQERTDQTVPGRATRRLPDQTQRTLGQIAQMDQRHR